MPKTYNHEKALVETAAWRLARVLLAAGAISDTKYKAFTNPSEDDVRADLDAMNRDIESGPAE